MKLRGGFMSEYSIALTCFRLGEIWGEYSDLTLPQVLKALVGAESEVEIMVHSSNGIPGQVSLETRPESLEKITNDQWHRQVESVYNELFDR